jgi:hypothetical protein
MPKTKPFDVFISVQEDYTLYSRERVPVTDYRVCVQLYQNNEMVRIKAWLNVPKEIALRWVALAKALGR